MSTARGVTAALALIVLNVPAAPLGAQTGGDSGIQIRLGGRMQAQYNTTSVNARDFDGARDDIPSSTFETRRIRLNAELEIGGWIDGVIEPDFALGRLSLRNAYMNLGFDDRFQLRMGQFKKPFSLINLTSSTKGIAIERGVRIRGLEDAMDAASAPGTGSLVDADGERVVAEQFTILESLGYLGYDLGLEAHGSFGRLGYSVGLFNGAGANARDDNDGKSVVGRLTYRPFPDRPLVIGAATSYREFVLGRSIVGGEMVTASRNGTAFEIDAEWGDFRRPGLHAIFEATAGDDLIGDDTFVGAQGAVSYYRPLTGPRIEGVEPLLRVSYGDTGLDRGGDSGWLLTPGVNLHFLGRNRLMLNWDVYVPAESRFRTEYALVLQAQLYFSELVTGRDGTVATP